MQQLQVFNSIWAMERRRPDGHEWSLEEQVEMLAEAGFDGMDLLCGRPDQARAAQRVLDRHGLGCSCCAFPTSIEGLQADIDLAIELGATHLNIIGQVYPFTVEEGASYVRGWLELCDRANLPVVIETHRDCITTDMLYTLQLLEAVPEMDLCADVSHFVVGREFRWPIPEQDDAWIHRVLERSKSFQGRVASREQIQIQLDFPQHEGWVELFFGWWEAGLRGWRAREPADAVLNFLCELGPPPYAITGADGYELSERWEEALVIKDRVREIWRRLESEAT